MHHSADHNPPKTGGGIGWVYALPACRSRMVRKSSLSFRTRRARRSIAAMWWREWVWPSPMKLAGCWYQYVVICASFFCRRARGCFRGAGPLSESVCEPPRDRPIPAFAGSADALASARIVAWRSIAAAARFSGRCLAFERPQLPLKEAGMRSVAMTPRRPLRSLADVS